MRPSRGPFALVVHSSLAYPAGPTKDRVERWLVRAAYATALTLPIAILMLHDVRDPLVQYGSLHRKSDLLLAREAHAVELLQKSFVVALYGVLAALFVLLVWRRLHSAPRGSRGILSPLLIAAAAIALWGAYECVVTFAERSDAGSALFWVQAVALLVLPPALLVGLLVGGSGSTSVNYHGSRDVVGRGYFIGERRPLPQTPLVWALVGLSCAVIGILVLMV